MPRFTFLPIVPTLRPFCFPSLSLNRLKEKYKNKSELLYIKIKNIHLSENQENTHKRKKKQKCETKKERKMFNIFNRGRDNSGDASPPTPSARPSSSASQSTGPPRPIRLVYCDEKGKFQMDPEAVAALQLVKEPIGVVSVCGRARQGKSYILNQVIILSLCYNFSRFLLFLKFRVLVWVLVCLFVIRVL